MKVYTATMDPTSVTVAKTLLNIEVDGQLGLLLRASVSQVGLTASEQLRVFVQRASSGGTGTAITPVRMEFGDPVFGVIARSNLTVEPLFTDAPYVEEAFNVVNGWVWVPMPEERPVITNSFFIGLRLDVAPSAAAIFSAQLTFGLFG